MESERKSSNLFSQLGLQGILDMSGTASQVKREQEVNFLKTLHVLAAGSLAVNLIYQQTTQREDDNSIFYHVFGNRPYFVSKAPLDDPTTDEFKYTLGTGTPTEGMHLELPWWLMIAEVIGILYHLASFVKLQFGMDALEFIGNVGGTTSQAGDRREAGRLRTRQARALYNSVASGIVQLTLMAVLAVSDEWLYLFVFATHVAYHFAILTVDKQQTAPKSWLGGSLVVLLLFAANSWFFYDISRIELTSLYRPRLTDDELAHTGSVATSDLVYTLKNCACKDSFDNYVSCVDSNGVPNPLLAATSTDTFPLVNEACLDDDPEPIACAVATTGECFDVFGEQIPSATNLDYLVAGHILINGFYALHLLFTKWPRSLLWIKDITGSSYDPREWWAVSQDLGYVVLDFMYMGAVPAGVYTIHRELSRAVFPHPSPDDKDDFDWETFQVVFFWVVLGVGVGALLNIRMRFRGNVRERQRVRDGLPTDRNAIMMESASLINAKAVTGMSKGEMVPMLGAGYA